MVFKFIVLKLPFPIDAIPTLSNQDIMAVIKQVIEISSFSATFHIHLQYANLFSAARL